MRSWGKLPLNYIEQWKNRRCDLVFTTLRMSGRPVSFCADAGNSTATGKYVVLIVRIYYRLEREGI